MNNKRFLAVLAATSVAGFLTPRLIPQTWLAYVLGVSFGLAFIWGVLCASSAKGGELPPGVGASSWIVLGTDRPGAKITDSLALKLFWTTLLYGLAASVGAFAAVPV